MVFFPREFHIGMPVPGGTRRKFIDQVLAESTLHLRRPLIPESEKKIHRDVFASAYREILVRHLGGAPEAEGQIAALARQSQHLEFDLLDLAGLHEEAVRKFLAGQDRDYGDEPVRRGKVFFAEVIRAGEAELTTGAGVENLARRVEELALSNQQLREEVDRRKVVEETLRARELLAGERLGKSREMQEEWRLLSRRLLAVQEDEQKLISRELHDVIAQTMTGINVRLAVLRSQTTTNAIELHRKIAETERLAEKSVEIVHQFASELHPAVLDDFGLIPALRTFVEAFSARNGVPVEITANPGADELPAATRTALYRIAREALGNVARHAGASRAEVKISRTGTLMRMEISDNGRGFLVSSRLVVPAPGEDGDRPEARLGLLGMKERAEMVGGTFKVESHPGSETTISVEIPVAESAAEADKMKTPVSTPSLT